MSAILRIGDDVRVVPGALAEGGGRPFTSCQDVAAVVGAIEAALLGLDERLDAIGIRRNRHADAAVRALRAVRVP